MNLNRGFQFSQGSLQDYLDCRRRFQLRYIEGIEWPAVESEPVLEAEKHMQNGARFHRMIQQQTLGMKEDRLAQMIDNPDLDRWWQNYLTNAPRDLPEQRHSEISLTTAAGKYRMIAKYDLIGISPNDQAMIVDWKTSRKLPKRTWLAERMQTKVYPLVLVEAGSHLNGGVQINPDKIEMVYWFSEHPESSIRFKYSESQYQKDKSNLTQLIDEISSLSGDSFFPTQDERRCTYCQYRSLCERAEEVGLFTEIDDTDLSTDFGLDIDLEQIVEIAF